MTTLSKARKKAEPGDQQGVPAEFLAAELRCA